MNALIPATKSGSSVRLKVQALPRLRGLALSTPTAPENGPVQAGWRMRSGRRAVGAGRAGSGVEGAEPPPPGAVRVPAPWPPAFGRRVFAGEYRFRSPGVAASRVSLGGPGRSEELSLRGRGVRGGRGTLTCPPSGSKLARPAVCHPAGTSRPPGGLGPLRWVLPGRWSRPELPALGHSLGRACRPSLPAGIGPAAALEPVTLGELLLTPSVSLLACEVGITQRLGCEKGSPEHRV